MKEVGLDLSFVLDKLFFADISHAVDENAAVVNASIIKIFDCDRFKPIAPPAELLELWKKDFGSVTTQYSKGIYLLHKLLCDFGNNMSLIPHGTNIPIYARIVNALKSFFSTAMNKHKEAIEGDWDTSQYGTMLSNAEFIVDVMMQRVAVKIFEKNVPELDEHSVRLKSMLWTLTYS